MRVKVSPHRRTLFLIACVLGYGIWSASQPSAQCSHDCGDINGNGSIGTADLILLGNVTHRFQPWTIGDSLCADMDDYQGLTMRDYLILMDAVFWGAGGAIPVCSPGNGPYVPIPNSGYELRYNSIIRTGYGYEQMWVHLDLEMPLSTALISLPFRITVDSQIVEIGEVIDDAWVGTHFDSDPYSGFYYGDSINIPDNHLMIAYGDNIPGYLSGSFYLGSVQLLDPGGMQFKELHVEPVEIPAGHRTPMALEAFTHDGYEIKLKPCIVCMPGDANNDRSVTSADILVLIHSVFKCGTCMPYPVLAAGDINCSGTFTSPDVIELVNYIFKSGPPPCDVEAECTITGSGWTCP